MKKIIIKKENEVVIHGTLQGVTGVSCERDLMMITSPSFSEDQEIAIPRRKTLPEVGEPAEDIFVFEKTLFVALEEGYKVELFTTMGE